MLFFTAGRGLSAAALAQIEAAAEFKWEDYLLETNSLSSPAKCFKQVSNNYLEIPKSSPKYLLYCTQILTILL